MKLIIPFLLFALAACDSNSNRTNLKNSGLCSPTASEHKNPISFEINEENAEAAKIPSDGFLKTTGVRVYLENKTSDGSMVQMEFFNSNLSSDPKSLQKRCSRGFTLESTLDEPLEFLVPSEVDLNSKDVKYSLFSVDFGSHLDSFLEVKGFSNEDQDFPTPLDTEPQSVEDLFTFDGDETLTFTAKKDETPAPNSNDSAEENAPVVYTLLYRNSTKGIHAQINFVWVKEVPVIAE